MPTAKNKPSLGAGDITIELMNADGELETKALKPTLRAMQFISRRNGGGVAAMEACAKADFDTIAEIVKHGLSLTDNGAKGLDERIFATGTMKLAIPCVNFVMVLMNGGRPVEEDDTDENPMTPVE